MDLMIANINENVAKWEELVKKQEEKKQEDN